MQTTSASTSLDLDTTVPQSLETTHSQVSDALFSGSPEISRRCFDVPVLVHRALTRLEICDPYNDDICKKNDYSLSRLVLPLSPQIKENYTSDADLAKWCT